MPYKSPALNLPFLTTSLAFVCFFIFSVNLEKSWCYPHLVAGLLKFVQFNKDMKTENHVFWLCTLSCGLTSWLSFAQVAQSSEGARINIVYEIGELFELGIQLFYLLILLGLLGVGTFFVIRQVLVRRELDLSAKELQVNSWLLLLLSLWNTLQLPRMHASGI